MTLQERVVRLEGIVASLQAQPIGGPRLVEARDWANAAEEMEALFDYIPTDHWTNDCTQIDPGSQYAEAYPALLAAIRECNQIAGLLYRRADQGRREK